jgi:hypothetical protein
MNVMLHDGKEDVGEHRPLTYLEETNERFTYFKRQ